MIVFLLLFSLFIPAAQQHDADAPAAEKPATLMTGLGRLHHPIATRSAEAQRFFDQGLTLVYGFNHDEAVRAFKRAAELDPASPMPHWGVALSLGPNINLDVDPDREKAASDEAQRAKTLAASAPANERAYVDALVTRYNEPADWFYPTRESLGAALLRAKRVDEAAQVFRDDLARNPNNGRSLYGLWRALLTKNDPARDTAEKDFKNAWKHADTPLRISDM